MLDTKEYNLFAQRIGLVGITNILLAPSGMFLIPLLTKTLPVEEYGIWAQIMVTIGLIPSLVTLGLPYAMVRFLAGAKKRDDIQEGFYSIAFIVFVTSISISYILFIYSNLIASTLFDNNIHVVRILAIIVFIECLNSTVLNFFRAIQHIKRYSVFIFIRTYLDLILVAYFVLSGYGIIGATIGILITRCLTLFIMTALVISEIGFKIPNFIYMKDYLAFGLPTVPGII